MHIAMIGGAGAVGREALSCFLRDYACNPQGDSTPLKITLVSPHPNRGNAFLNELREAFSVSRVAKMHNPFGSITATATDQYDNLEGVDLVVLLASTVPTNELQQRLQADNIDPRTAFAFANRDLVRGISEEIQLVSPNAHFLVVTNQSDLMARQVREYFPVKNVLGFGGITDTYRLRMLLETHTRLNPSIDHIKANEAIQRCYIIGYHNDYMILLPSNPQIPGLNSVVLETVLQHTRNRGHKIAAMGRDPDSSSAKPPYMLAGAGVAMTMAALTGRMSPIEEAFNVRLDEKAAGYYGVPTGTDLSVPVRLGPSGYEFIFGEPVSENDQHRIMEAVDHMDEGYGQLIKFNARRPTAVASAKSISPAPSPGGAVAAA